MQLNIRLATPADLTAINDIYNHYVLTSTCTYQTEPSTAEERLEWFQGHGERHPVTVAEEGGNVLGWASLSPFRSRRAYENSVENSVYIRHDIRGKGTGSALLSDLIERARVLGYHTIIAGADADQVSSVALHVRFGFIEVGRFRQVGYKFDRWLDVIFMQLML